MTPKEIVEICQAIERGEKMRDKCEAEALKGTLQ